MNIDMGTRQYLDLYPCFEKQADVCLGKLGQNLGGCLDLGLDLNLDIGVFLGFFKIF